MNMSGDIQYQLGDGRAARIKFSESAESFSIDSVFVPSSHRSGGIGRLLVLRVLYMADCEGKKVYLTARPVGSQSAEARARLEKFYEKFGFSTYDTGVDSAYMVRMPSFNNP